MQSTTWISCISLPVLQCLIYSLRYSECLCILFLHVCPYLNGLLVIFPLLQSVALFLVKVHIYTRLQGSVCAWHFWHFVIYCATNNVDDKIVLMFLNGFLPWFFKVSTTQVSDSGLLPVRFFSQTPLFFLQKYNFFGYLELKLC